MSYQDGGLVGDDNGRGFSSARRLATGPEDGGQRAARRRTGRRGRRRALQLVLAVVHRRRPRPSPVAQFATGRSRSTGCFTCQNMQISAIQSIL